jgi:hypothetical protein
MNNKLEYVYAIGLIVGGTEIQPIHYDVAKSLKNELLYDKVMGMGCPPAGLLVGFGHPVRLGVLKEEVELSIDEDGQEQCTVTGASPDYYFRIVSDEPVIHHKADKTVQTTNIVVLEGDCGFCFKGDFRHAGAPMVLTAGLPDVAIWSETQKVLEPLLVDDNNLKSKNVEKTSTNLCKEALTKLCDEALTKLCKETFPKLYGVKSLNIITRLHVQLCPILKEGDEFIIDHDAVGFDIDESENVLKARRNVQRDGNDS